MAANSGGPENIQLMSTKPQVSSYANVTRTQKNQAIIIDAVDYLTNDDYVDGIETLIPTSEIVSISRISAGRIQIFLSSKPLAEKLSGATITVKNLKFTIRPLIESNKRLVMSNVQTHIPNELLLEALSKHGIIPVSSVQHIKASLSKPGRSHILSHRRQVYIKEKDVTKSPESFQITYEDTPYWIFLSTDSTICFICKQAGHLAKACPNTNQSRSEASSLQSSINHSQSNAHAHNSSPKSPSERNNADPVPTLQRNEDVSTTLNEPSSQTEDITDTDRIMEPNNDKKRTHSIISSNDSQHETIPQLDNESIKTPPKPPAKKRTKKGKTENLGVSPSNLETEEDSTQETDTEEDMDKKLKNIKVYLSDKNTILNYTQFKSLLENVQGAKNPTDIALQHTQDLEALIKFIKEDIYPNANNRSIKYRCTSLIKHIQQNAANHPSVRTQNISDADSS